MRPPDENPEMYACPRNLGTTQQEITNASIDYLSMWIPFELEYMGSTSSIFFVDHNAKRFDIHVPTYPCLVDCLFQDTRESSIRVSYFFVGNH